MRTTPSLAAVFFLSACFHPTREDPLARPATGGELRLSLSAGPTKAGALPRELRLTVENPGDRPVTFRAPAPVCTNAKDGTRDLGVPVLQTIFRDGQGREADAE